MSKTTTFTETYFEPTIYIDSLMEEIGFKNTKESEKEAMREGLEKQLSYLITNAISLCVEPEQMDETILNYGNLEDIGEFIENLVAISPEAQLAIMETLDNFYEETVETYKEFGQ
ncbi:hypothetical protein KAR91_67925 [Candidatus Pacearchaeota archaeon]|nr:hypothetical protein [Candidatus Pacearchaeota archaeon]